MAQTHIEEVPVERILCGINVRHNFPDDSMRNLAVTIREHGIQVALIVLRRHDGTLHLIDGARRLSAAKAANLATVPCLIEDGELSDVEIMERQFVVNCQRSDLTPLEKAKVLEALISRTGMTATQAAAKVGFSNATVTRLLSLLTLPPEMQAQVDAGTLPVSSAYEIARIADPALQAQRAADVAGGRLTRDELAGAGKAARRLGGIAPSAETAERVTTKLGRDRTVTVSCPNLNLDVFIASLTELVGRAKQARTQGLALETFRKILSDQAASEK